MVFIAREEPFECENCGFFVEPLGKGSYRNHCPKCLCSKHVDRDGPGDRASECGGIMKPVGIDGNNAKGWVLLHRCERCGKTGRNKCAPDDEPWAFDGASTL